jgi:hypothetical protein
LGDERQAAESTSPRQSEPRWLDSRVILGGYLALTLLLYAPVVNSFFLSDDFFYLSQVVHLDFPGVLLLQPGVFRPLHVASWLVDYHLWGLNPLGYHLTNIVSHALTAFLVCVVARQLFRRVIPQTEATWAAAFAGLVFLVHPSHTEAVSWIIGRHDVLATLFVLCAWFTYMQYQDRSRLTDLALSLCAFFIALLFKESPLTFPLILAAYEGWLLLAERLEGVGDEWHWQSPGPASGDETRRTYPASAQSPSFTSRLEVVLGLYVAVVAVYLLLRRLTAGELVSDFESPFIHPSPAILGNLSSTVFRSFLPYVPVQLLPEAPKLGLTGISIALAGVAGVCVALVWIVTNVRHPTPTKLLASFLVVALVISAIPTLAFGRPSIISSEGERYAYLPSVFASMLVGLAVTVLVKTRVARTATAVLVLVFLGAFLELSNQNWRTAGELTSSILADVAAQPTSSEPIVLLVPDDLNGAFIYRNGLPEALALFAPQPAPSLSIIGRAFLERPDETIALNPIGDNAYRMSIPAARGALVPVTLDLPPGVTTSREDLYRFDLTLLRPMRLGYYSNGEMQFVDLAPR